MATQPNAHYDPRTGELTYDDGTVVTPGATPMPTTSPYAQDQVVGNIGCCTQVYAYVVPNDVILEAFNDGLSPMVALLDERIVFKLGGREVPAPAEWSTVHLQMTAAKLVSWGLLPHSPFQQWHVAEYMTTLLFDTWIYRHPLAREVPSGSVTEVKAWVDTDPEVRAERARVALKVERVAEQPRSTLIAYLVEVEESENG